MKILRLNPMYNLKKIKVLAMLAPIVTLVQIRFATHRKWAFVAMFFSKIAQLKHNTKINANESMVSELFKFY
jgi:hypothetical protein